MLSELPLLLVLKILQKMDTISFVRTYQTSKLIGNSINLSSTKFRKETTAEFYGTLLSVTYGDRHFNLTNRLSLLNSYRVDMFHFRRIHITTGNAKYSDDLSNLMKVLKAARVVCQEVLVSTPMCKEDALQFKPTTVDVDGSWEGFNGQYFRFFLVNVLPGVERLIIRSSRIAEITPIVDFFRYVERSRQQPETKEIMIQLRDLKIDISKFLAKISCDYYRCADLNYGKLGIVLMPTVENSFIAMTYDVDNGIMRITYRVLKTWSEFKGFYHRSFWFHKNITNGPELHLDDNPRFRDIRQLFAKV